MYKIIQKRKIWLSISGLAVAVSVLFLLMWGLDLGIDFTGGSLLEVKFSNERPTTAQTQSLLEPLNLGSLLIQPLEADRMILRFKDTSEEKHQEVLEKLNTLSNNQVEEMRFDSVGPSIGQELKSKSITAIILVLIFIVLYIAYVFRKVSKPVASWKYGLTAIIALFHDVLITMGVFSYLGHFYNVEVNAPFVAAILTVLGYSVNDTIVVFDRLRENLPKTDKDFEDTVNLSVNETITRSINTSFTTLLVLLAIFFYGGSSIKSFVLALSIGVFVGTYSSIFLASPLLVVWEKLKK